MKNSELYDIVESLLDTDLNALKFQRDVCARANWFRQTRTRFLRFLIEVHHNTRWQSHLGGTFNVWLGFVDKPEQRIIAPEDSFSLDTLLDDTMLKRRTDMRNRIIRKMISVPVSDELSQLLKNSTDELLRSEIPRGIHSNSGGQCKFYDAKDVKSWCIIILEMLPHIIGRAESRSTIVTVSS